MNRFRIGVVLIAGIVCVAFVRRQSAAQDVPPPPDFANGSRPGYVSPNTGGNHAPVSGEQYPRANHGDGFANFDGQMIQPESTVTRVMTGCPADCPPKGFWGRMKHRMWGRWFKKPCGPEIAPPSKPPAGAFLQQHFDTQIGAGNQARMALRQYDFARGASALNSRGKQRLKRISKMLPSNSFPVVIEPSGDPVIDTQRRQTVYADLSIGTIPIPVERVVVGASAVRGLPGQEAERIYQNRLKQTENGGSATSTQPAKTKQP